MELMGYTKGGARVFFIFFLLIINDDFEGKGSGGFEGGRGR